MAIGDRNVDFGLCFAPKMPLLTASVIIDISCVK